MNRASGFYPVGRGFESLLGYHVGRSIALVDDYKDGYGDGPIRIGLGGLVVAVEVARNDNLTFIKKYDIIFI